MLVTLQVFGPFLIHFWLISYTMFINFSFRFNVLFFILYLLPVILYSLLCTIIVTFHIFFTGDPSHLSRNCSWHFYAILGFSWLLLATPNLSCFHQRPPGSSGFLLIAIGSSENHDRSQRPVFFSKFMRKVWLPFLLITLIARYLCIFVLRNLVARYFSIVMHIPNDSIWTFGEKI